MDISSRTKKWIVETPKGSRTFYNDGDAERYFTKQKNGKKTEYNVIKGGVWIKVSTAYVGNYMDDLT